MGALQTIKVNLEDVRTVAAVAAGLSLRQRIADFLRTGKAASPDIITALKIGDPEIKENSVWKTLDRGVGTSFVQFESGEWGNLYPS